MAFFDRFRGLSTAQQMLAVALLVCVVGSIIGASWFFMFRTTYRPLFTDLKPVDAATIVADLDKKKIDYQLADGGATILVPTGQADATRLDVMTEDLPLKGTVGFELFNKSDMGITDFAQKINYLRALQGELERTIMSLDGVDTARVHLSMGEDRIFRDDQVPPKASVSVRMKPGVSLSDTEAHGIARMIAAAVPNLDVDNVVILNEAGQVIGLPPPVVAAPLPAPLDQERSAIAQYYAARIRESLAGAYADAHIDVTIPDSPQAPGAASAASPFGQWSAGTRQFPLAVAISSPVALEASAQDTLRNFVANVIGTSAATPDQITFVVAPLSVAQTPEPRPPVHHAEAPPGSVPVLEARSQPGPLALLALALVTVAGLAGVYVFVSQMKKPRRMSNDERDAFVGRLRTMLSEGARRAA